jgi:hypothetical protein
MKISKINKEFIVLITIASVNYNLTNINYGETCKRKTVKLYCKDENYIIIMDEITNDIIWIYSSSNYNNTDPVIPVCNNNEPVITNSNNNVNYYK